MMTVFTSSFLLGDYDASSSLALDAGESLKANGTGRVLGGLLRLFVLPDLFILFCILHDSSFEPPSFCTCVAKAYEAAWKLTGT